MSLLPARHDEDSSGSDLAPHEHLLDGISDFDWSSEHVSESEDSDATGGERGGGMSVVAPMTSTTDTDTETETETHPVMNTHPEPLSSSPRSEVVVFAVDRPENEPDCDTTHVSSEHVSRSSTTTSSLRVDGSDGEEDARVEQSSSTLQSPSSSYASGFTLASSMVSSTQSLHKCITACRSLLALRPRIEEKELYDGPRFRRRTDLRDEVRQILWDRGFYSRKKNALSGRFFREFSFFEPGKDVVVDVGNEDAYDSSQLGSDSEPNTIHVTFSVEQCEFILRLVGVFALDIDSFVSFLRVVDLKHDYEDKVVPARQLGFWDSHDEELMSVWPALAWIIAPYYADNQEYMKLLNEKTVPLPAADIESPVPLLSPE